MQRLAERIVLSVILIACAAACSSRASSASTSPAPASATETKPFPASETPAAAGATPSEGAPVIDHQVQTLQGETIKLDQFRGKALLIVNTASECGYTPQYEGLQKIYDKYQARGLVVIGFPSNDFGAQEPGSAEDIATFCKKNYGVTFPIMAKVHAKGPEIAPVYKTLTQDTPEGIKGDVKWNFTKFLVDPTGKIVARFEPKVTPESPELTGAIENVLPQ
jgi:glutathione peroxidase